MKIVHVITSLEIGGAQRLLADLLPLQCKGNKVEVVVIKDLDSPFRKTLEVAGIKIVGLNCGYYNFLIAFKLIRFIKDADIVHVHLFTTLYWAALSSMFCRKVKLVYTEHSTHNKRRDKCFLRPLEILIYSRYKRIISISQQTQDNLKRWLRVKDGDHRFVVVENGVVIDHFSSKKSNIDENRLIMVSRFARMKDQETAIRAMINVDKRAHLYLVGDGPNRQHCENIAKELNLLDRVHFLGARSDIAELISCSYIGIQSSLWEGFGLTAVEIMAAGKPVIASNVEGLRQVVEGAGLLFDVRDYKMLALQINALLSNKEYYTQVAQKCMDRALQYDILKMQKRYQDIYNIVCGLT